MDSRTNAASTPRHRCSIKGQVLAELVPDIESSAGTLKPSPTANALASVVQGYCHQALLALIQTAQTHQNHSSYRQGYLDVTDVAVEPQARYKIEGLQVYPAYPCQGKCVSRPPEMVAVVDGVASSGRSRVPGACP